MTTMSATINNPKRPVVQSCLSSVETNDECGFKLNANVDLALIMLEQGKKQQMKDINRSWSKFSNSQKSMPTYLNDLCTHSKSSCLAKKLRNESFPKETIERRLLNMRPIGNLTKQDMYYLLAFILNLNLLHPLRRRDIMELLQQRNLLNNAILNYLQIVVRRPSILLNPKDIEAFIILCEEIKANTSAHHTTPNPYDLITQSEGELDSKQLAYLKNILKTKSHLSQNQLLYLLNLLDGLQDVPETQRNKFFQTLCKNQDLAVSNVQILSAFLQQHSRPFDSRKLRTLLYELEDLMGIEPQTPRIIRENVNKVSKLLGEIDLPDLRKSLDYLMKGGIPNIVRLNNFKQFLSNLLTLNPEQLQQNLKQLKNSNALSLEDFKFIQNFVSTENLEGDVEKKNLLCQLLKQVGSTTIDKTPSAVLSIAPAKGPKPIICSKKEDELQRNLQALTPCALYEARLDFELQEKSKNKGEIIAGVTEKMSTNLTPTAGKQMDNIPTTRKEARTSEAGTGKQSKTAENATEKTAAVDSKKQKGDKDKMDALEEKAEVQSKKNVMAKTKPQKGKLNDRKEKGNKTAELSNTEKQTNGSEIKQIKTKDKLKSKEPLDFPTDNKDEVPVKTMKSADRHKGAKTTSKQDKETKGLPIETIFTNIEDKSVARKAKVTQHKELYFEVVTSDLSVAGHEEEDLQDAAISKAPIESGESLSKTKPTTEIKSSSDSIGKKTMPIIMDSQQPKSAALGVSFFKSRSFLGKTNKIVSIRNGKLILR